MYKARWQMSGESAVDRAGNEGHKNAVSGSEAPVCAAAPSKSVSIKDVAKLAGVSMQSVSRVSNGSASVSPQLRERVTRAMHELGYRPNRVARALRSGRTWTLGLFVERLETSGSELMLESLMDAAAKRGYGLTLIPIGNDAQVSVIASSPFVASLDVEGMIVNDRPAVAEAIDQFFPDTPVVSIGKNPDRENWSSMDLDQELIGRLAVEHLLDLGHKTVYHVGGEQISNSAIKRAQSWEQVLHERGCEVPPFEYAGWWADDGYRVGKKLAEDPNCTAVFCANDTLALGVIKALQESGLRVPEDVSVVGVDDSVNGYYPNNNLTTVSQRYAEAGRSLVELLIDRINGGGPKHVMVGDDLIVRGTTGPMRERVGGR